MNKTILSLLVSALGLSLASSAYAARFQPGMVTFGNRYDKGATELAYIGAERFKKAFSLPYLSIQVEKQAQYVQALRTLARCGADPVIAVGAFGPAIKTVAREFPQRRFVLIDEQASGPNITSVTFREHEGAFLVGMAAALKSRSRRIGFIGGMDTPLIRDFGCGYLQGARYVDPRIKVLQNMAGIDENAFLDPARGTELARSQFDRGVDVVFTAASLTSLGVLSQAKTAGKLAIGVDSNQNGLYPGSILTSMLKRMDVAVYSAMLDAKRGTLRPGSRRLGLKEDGVGWALDKHNRRLISPEMERRINAARDAIIVGRLKVVDYRSAQRCPLA